MKHGVGRRLVRLEARLSAGVSESRPVFDLSVLSEDELDDLEALILWIEDSKTPNGYAQPLTFDAHYALDQMLNKLFTVY